MKAIRAVTQQSRPMDTNHATRHLPNSAAVQDADGYEIPRSELLERARQQPGEFTALSAHQYLELLPDPHHASVIVVERRAGGNVLPPGATRADTDGYEVPDSLQAAAYNGRDPLEINSSVNDKRTGVDPAFRRGVHDYKGDEGGAKEVKIELNVYEDTLSAQNEASEHTYSRARLEQQQSSYQPLQRLRGIATAGSSTSCWSWFCLPSISIVFVLIAIGLAVALAYTYFLYSEETRRGLICFAALGHASMMTSAGYHVTAVTASSFASSTRWLPLPDVEHGRRRASRTVEFCHDDVFNISCSSDSVIIVQSARYGRMIQNRCVSPTQYEQRYVQNVTSSIEQDCSGRRECVFDMSATIRPPRFSCSKPDVLCYLEVTYKCLQVAPPPLCANDTLNSTTGTIASSSQSQISTLPPSSLHPVKSCPWTIHVESYQRIDITLVDFSSNASRGATNDNGSCVEYAVVREVEGSKPFESQLCAGRERDRVVYSSRTNVVQVRLNAAAAQRATFLLRYEAVWCAPPVPPPGTWIKRTNDSNKIEVRCISSSTDWWKLTCRGRNWVSDEPGRNCTKHILPSYEAVDTKSESVNLPIWIVLTGGVVIGVITGVILFIAIQVFMQRGCKCAFTADESATSIQPGSSSLATPALSSAQRNLRHSHFHRHT